MVEYFPFGVVYQLYISKSDMTCIYICMSGIIKVNKSLFFKYTTVVLAKNPKDQDI